MKLIQLLFVSLFLFSITVNAQSTQENPITSTNVTGYLKIPDISGESKSSRFKDEIEIFGLASLIEQTSGNSLGTGRIRAKANMTPISLVKNIDAATPYLMLANMQGKVFREVIITLVKSENNAQTPYLIIKLQNVSIKKHQIDSSSNRQEIISLDFEKITTKYINKGKEHEITYDLSVGK
ncbi:type VI secretion system secreted protein Hcp [Mariniflexile fucanivorans]|uniref:Type VI secretion system secreted protein Hcp n=1 Tax=Mariniflexile fucanivorans TaxID=264023 RepID=A0A4R1RG30_9FLAO|nr:type VI secretion system tube protein Hcp [Mariniflexile fucanivorans]TCL64886.1 type VI secretion system secreted protein Hcp [Mariniflexile fucanivorans]